MPSKRPAATEPSAEAPAPVVRRVSNPRPRKPGAKPAAEAESGDSVPSSAPPAAAEPAKDAVVPAAPQFTAPYSDFDDDSPSIASDWPEPETFGQPAPEGGGKRKRRRRKGKGQGGNAGPPPATFAAGETPTVGGNAEPSSAAHPAEEPREPGRPPRHSQSPPRPPEPRPAESRPPLHRPKLDPAALARRAWKIYLAEVSEEGVVLINDQDARELTRRCFRLAEIFLEEEARRS